MDFKYKYKGTDNADLDVTSFMNLMIVLVPVLLITLTFTQTSVLDIHLPELTGGAANSERSQSQLVVKVQSDGFRVFYPDDVLIKEVPLRETEDGQVHDYPQLSRVMQQVKSELGDRRSVLVLSEPAVDYQNLVSTMNAVRSYKTVLVASVVEIELFPEISLGDVK